MVPRLVLFARYPTAGAAKTRLIPALGAEDAARVHRQLTERTLGVLMSSRFRKEVGHAAYKWAHNRTAASQIADAIYPFNSDADDTGGLPEGVGG